MLMESETAAEKGAILRQRKEIKAKGRAVVKSHYFLLFFVALVMILFGREYRLATAGWGESVSESAQDDEVGSVLDRATVFSRITDGDDAVLTDIMSGRLFDAQKKSLKIAAMIREKGDENPVLGTTNGILAQFVNGIVSERFIAMFGNTVYSIVRSEEAVAVIFIVLSFIWYTLIFVFVKNVFTAVYCRVFLEARTYEKVTPADALHLLAVRRWIRASITMLISELWLTLWSFTIVGGFIKRFSYAAVPYIVAENPDLKGPETVTLSRKMMDGHKMELFLFELSMLGWVALGIVTFGISEIVWGVAFRSACKAEFYARIREDAIRRKVEGWEKLNNPYLFDKADRILLYETYFDVVDEITLLHENRVELTGAKKKAADWFGVWLGTLDEKRKYDEMEGRAYTIRHLKRCMEGQSFPDWLDPLWRKREIAKYNNFSFLNNYSIWTLFLLFISFSFLGWSWEVALHFMQTGAIANRGTLLGPWLPIYGAGGVIALILCSRFRRQPVTEFFLSILLCGTLEYFSGWYLESKFHQRWWSYDGYFLNLHGRICAEGLLVFGVGCCIVVYLIAPVFDYLLSKVKKGILIPFCVALAVLFGVDQIHAIFHPNMTEGAIEPGKAAVTAESGEAPEEENTAGRAPSQNNDSAAMTEA